ncbi:hypothetical protein, partial [Caldisericum sp.]|uniref:hypothetical protein n=1 Tax=Caldisericum sp. TaxID=2499687 RepID=UPI003D0EF7FC
HRICTEDFQDTNCLRLQKAILRDANFLTQAGSLRLPYLYRRFSRYELISLKNLKNGNFLNKIFKEHWSKQASPASNHRQATVRRKTRLAIARSKELVK